MFHKGCSTCASNEVLGCLTNVPSFLNDPDLIRKYSYYEPYYYQHKNPFLVFNISFHHVILYVAQP